MQFNFIKKSQIKAQDLMDSTKNYLVGIYKQSAEAFTYATSYGQILLTTENLFSLVIFYMSDSITELNIHTARRAHSIYGIARLQGHSAMRGKSAVGEISLKYKATSQKTIVGNFVYVGNYTRLACSNNGLQYLLSLSADDVAIDITSNSQLRMRVVEGKFESQYFQGTGESNQMYEAAGSTNKMIEDDSVMVTVNGVKYPIYDSLYDIPFRKPGCLIKTAITNGVDVIFGSSFNHIVPLNGEQIRVDYILTNGALGNLLDRTNVEFKFLDSGFDVNGNEVDLNEFFDVHTELPMDFGANAEDPAMTKVLAPNISRSFIIHDERSIKYFLGRMNYFSVIKVFKNIFDNVNQFTVLALPKLSERLNPGEDYFSVDPEKYLLTTIEETRIFNTLEESGKKSANIHIAFLKPKVRKAAIILVIEAFERYEGRMVRREDVRREVRSVINNYMLNNVRVNKIPHSDIVREIDEISYIDTVRAVFIPQYAEDIDTKGNLSVAENHMIQIRGGFKDSHGVMYEDEFDPIGEPLGSVNLDITFVKNIV